MAKNQKVMGTVMEKILGIEEVTGCEAVVMRGAEEVRMLAEWYGFFGGWGGGGEEGEGAKDPPPYPHCSMEKTDLPPATDDD